MVSISEELSGTYICKIALSIKLNALCTNPVAFQLKGSLLGRTFRDEETRSAEAHAEEGACEWPSGCCQPMCFRELKYSAMETEQAWRFTSSSTKGTIFE